MKTDSIKAFLEVPDSEANTITDLLKEHEFIIEKSPVGTDIGILYSITGPSSRYQGLVDAIRAKENYFLWNDEVRSLFD